MKMYILALLAALGLSACLSTAKKPETAPLLTPAASTPACAYEILCDCPAPGHTLRWELNYCEEKLKVHSCDKAFKCADQMAKKFKKQLKGKSNCKKNEFWREKYCKDFHKKTYKDCLKEVPEIIKTGC